MKNIKINWEEKDNLKDDVSAEIFNNAFMSIQDGFDDTKKAIEENKVDADKTYVTKEELAPNNLFTGIEVVYGRYHTSIEEKNDAYNYFKEIPVKAGVTYYCNKEMRFASLLDSEKTYITHTQRVKSFTPTVDGYANVTITTENFGDTLKLAVTTDFETIMPLNMFNFPLFEYTNDKIEHTNDRIKNLESTNNLFTGIEVVYGRYHASIEEKNDAYNYFKEIPVKAGVTYYCNKEMRFASLLDSEKTYITHTQRVKSFTPTVDGYANVTITTENFGDTLKLAVTTDFETIMPLNMFNLPLFKEMNAKIKEVQANLLYGKTWYACGDSFTAGDFTGLTEGYTFEDEPYLGEKKVYPYFVGRHAGMNVVNLAVGGMTMAQIEGKDIDFCTSKYQKIGADADYITLKFGINDGHRNVPIGTISDTDLTTFYGAWNNVMTWLITNRPTAKIGIIVSNALKNDSYAEATINIAKKYGVPYLNEWNGEQVPVLVRSGRKDVDASILSIRDENFRVGGNNWHPNVACHEYESAFVEEWLKTL